MTDQTSQPDLLADLGLEHLNEEERTELVGEIGEVILRGVMRKAWNVLSLKEQEELTALLEASAADQGSDEKHAAIDTFLKEHVADLPRYVSDEVEAFKKAQRNAVSELE